MTGDILTPKEAAEYLRISPRTLASLLKARKIPAKKIGGQWRFHRLALDKFVGAPPSHPRPPAVEVA